MGMVYVDMQSALECYDKNKPKSKRGSKEKTVCSSNTETYEKCCHGLLDLEGMQDLWWCGKAYHHSEAWEGQILGCISCEREFLKVGGRVEGAFMLIIQSFVWLTNEQLERLEGFCLMFFPFICLWMKVVTILGMVCKIF